MGRLIIVDASAGVEIILLGERAGVVHGLVEDNRPAFVPAHFDAEAWSAVARIVRRRIIEQAAARALALDLAGFPASRVPLTRLLPAVASWLPILSGSDSFYAALASGPGAPLLTCDLGLARALDGRLEVLYVAPTVY